MGFSLPACEFRPSGSYCSSIEFLHTQDILWVRGGYAVISNHEQILIVEMDKELIILEQIQNNPHVNQRDLATIAQASLGMTNVILKRFAEKGLITVKKVNNRNIRYALTSKGLEEIGRRSWSYFKRTIKNIVVYQDAISEIIRQAIENGFVGVVLFGESDLTFIIEHICYKKNVPFQCIDNEEDISAGWFIFVAETQHLVIADVQEENRFSLNRLVLS